MSAPRRPNGLRAGAVRRCLLAVVVLHDLDLQWDDRDVDPDDGLPELRLEGTPPVLVPPARLRRILAADDPEATASVARLAHWLTMRRVVAGLPLPLLMESLRVVGLPREHLLHPGPAWVRAHVPGGALDLGLGLLHEDERVPGSASLGPESAGSTEAASHDLGYGELPVPLPFPTPVPLPPGALGEDDDLPEAADGIATDVTLGRPAGTGAAVEGVDLDAGWMAAVARLDQLGELAAARRRRRPRDPLRPLGEADVVTLLGSRAFRTALAEESGAGLAGLVVPNRTRGWVSSAAIDPAFGPAAAAATEPEQRGFPRPLLVTADEVVQVPPGGHPLTYLGGQQQRSRFS